MTLPLDTDRMETYAHAVMGALDCGPYVNRRDETVCVNEEHEKAGPWVAGIGCPFAIARARAVVAIANAEQQTLRDRLGLAVEKLAKVREQASAWEADSSLMDGTRRPTCCADARDDERVDVVQALRAILGPEAVDE